MKAGENQRLGASDRGARCKPVGRRSGP